MRKGLESVYICTYGKDLSNGTTWCSCCPILILLCSGLWVIVNLFPSSFVYFRFTASDYPFKCSDFLLSLFLRINLRNLIWYLQLCMLWSHDISYRYAMSSSSPPQPQNSFENPLTVLNWSLLIARTPPTNISYCNLKIINNIIVLHCTKSRPLKFQIELKVIVKKTYQQ